MANNVLLLSNADAPGTHLVYPLVVAKQGSLTANNADNPAGVFPFDVKVVRVVGGVLTNGVDAINPLQVAFDVKKQASAATSGTSVLSTLPVVAKAAGTGFRSTAAAGTGITQAVINSAQETVAAGSLISVDFGITRTASPSTEIAGPFVIVWVAPQAGADNRTYTAFDGL